MCGGWIYFDVTNSYHVLISRIIIVTTWFFDHDALLRIHIPWIFVTNSYYINSFYIMCHIVWFEFNSYWCVCGWTIYFDITNSHHVLISMIIILTTWWCSDIDTLLRIRISWIFVTNSYYMKSFYYDTNSYWCVWMNNIFWCYEFASCFNFEFVFH